MGKVKVGESQLVHIHDFLTFNCRVLMKILVEQSRN